MTKSIISRILSNIKIVMFPPKANFSSSLRKSDDKWSTPRFEYSNSRINPESSTFARSLLELAPVDHHPQPEETGSHQHSAEIINLEKYRKRIEDTNSDANHNSPVTPQF